MTVEFQSDKPERVIFHYNKANLADPAIPMWIVKHKGKTYYVHHMESQIGFSTKETPDNEATKASLQFNKASLRIEEDNEERIAYIN